MTDQPPKHVTSIEWIRNQCIMQKPATGDLFATTNEADGIWSIDHTYEWFKICCSSLLGFRAFGFWRCVASLFLFFIVDILFRSFPFRIDDAWIVCSLSGSLFQKLNLKVPFIPIVEQV